MTKIVGYNSKQFGGDYVAHVLDREAIHNTDDLAFEGDLIATVPYFYSMDGYSFVARHLDGTKPTFHVDWTNFIGFAANGNVLGAIG
jgi:hypothetical protein